MASSRRCPEPTADGRSCGAPPLRSGSFCFWHDPGLADDRLAAQRLGGANRRRQVTLAAAFDFAGIHSIEDVGQLLATVTTDLLGMPSSIARTRQLVSLIGPSLRLAERTEISRRLDALEAARPPDGAR